MCDAQEIRELKQDNRLEMLGDFLGEDECILSYNYEDSLVAYIRISVDTIEKSSLWIDEFEVLREYRKKGIGKRAIAELIKDSPSDINNIKIMAKNKTVQQFWQKCGFEDDGITCDEIPMI
jgi:predicted GNAT family N-acyltransferase